MFRKAAHGKNKSPAAFAARRLQAFSPAICMGRARFRHPARESVLLQLFRHGLHRSVQRVTHPLHGLAYSGFPALGTGTDDHLCGDTHHNSGGHAPEKRTLTHLQFTPLSTRIVSPICPEKTVRAVAKFRRVAYNIHKKIGQIRKGAFYVC